MDEFELIDRFFRPLGGGANGVSLGIGDDAAILEPAPDEQLVVTTDTQVESVHFPVGADARAIGYRACAASLSDIAAMGGAPRWASLALTLPAIDEAWLDQFARGSAEALESCGAELIGGDTTRGPISISWHIIGTVPAGRALRRDRAQAGEVVYVSGTLGGASAAVDLALLGEGEYGDDERELRERYWHPRPRVDLGLALQGVASSCIDISDGLLADLSHVVHASGCGAVLTFDDIPVLPGLEARVGFGRARELALVGGDDYELCFTVAEDREGLLRERAPQFRDRLTKVGHIVAGSGVKVVDTTGAIREFPAPGYRHFS